MVAINAKEMYRFEVKPLIRPLIIMGHEEISLQSFGSAWLRNHRLPLTLKEKISAGSEVISS